MPLANMSIRKSAWKKGLFGKDPPSHTRIQNKEKIISKAKNTQKGMVKRSPASDYVIFQHFRGGKSEKIGLDEKVDFTARGVERFRTLPVDQTEGEKQALRSNFDMPQSDREFLEARGLPWEAVIEANYKWLLIHDFSVPAGYNHSKVTAGLMIVSGYPDAQIDMVYFYPALARLDGKPIKALASQNIDGTVYQRWSRHRTPKNPWRPGEDDVSTHLAQVEFWLEKELGSK